MSDRNDMARRVVDGYPNENWAVAGVPMTCIIPDNWMVAIRAQDAEMREALDYAIGLWPSYETRESNGDCEVL